MTNDIPKIRPREMCVFEMRDLHTGAKTGKPIYWSRNPKDTAHPRAAVMFAKYFGRGVETATAQEFWDFLNFHFTGCDEPGWTSRLEMLGYPAAIDASPTPVKLSP